MSYAAEVAAIIRDAVIAGALVYVIQLMRQQTALLHQESKVKQSEIDVHKATIEHLTKFQAPAIARDLEQMTKTAENYAKGKAELERQVAILAKQNAAIDKTVNMAFNVGLTAGSFETAAALTLSIGRIRAFSILAGEKELPPDLNSIVNDLEKKLAHFRALADQALKGEVVEFKFTSQVVGMYKTLTDNWPSTGSTFYGERNLKDGEGD